MLYLSFFFNEPATTEIYTLSLHDALPICNLSFHEKEGGADRENCCGAVSAGVPGRERAGSGGRRADGPAQSLPGYRAGAAHSEAWRRWTAIYFGVAFAGIGRF